MAQKLVDLNPDLKRLRDEGYYVCIANGHLLVGDVPYVDANKTVQRGTIVSTLELEQDRTIKPTDHTVWFVGTAPYKADGQDVGIVIEQGAITIPVPGVVANSRFSSKPVGGYPDYTRRSVRT